MTESTQQPQPTQQFERVRLFNEFQAQTRARMESALKLAMLVSGGMLTVSVGAVLGGSHVRIPTDLMPHLEWAWRLFFYNIAGSIVLFASMIGATFHMGVRWGRALQSGATSTVLVATWSWLRIANAALAASVLACFLVGVYFLGQVAVGVASAANTVPTASTAHPDQQVTPVEAGAPAESQLKERAALDRKLVDYSGELAQYTLALAILAGLQFLALCAQVIFLRLAFKEARRGGDIARDAMVAGERAFVFALGVTGFFELDSNTGHYNWRLRPNWQNSGDTPTRHMTMNSTCLLRTEPLPLGFDFDAVTRQTAKALIAPKVTAHGGLVPTPPAAALTPQDILDVQAGRKFLYALGWARYSDVFPGTPQHITRFCWMVTPTGDPLTFTPEKPNSVAFQTIHHSEGNCADDECTALVGGAVGAHE